MLKMLLGLHQGEALSLFLFLVSSSRLWKALERPFSWLAVLGWIGQQGHMVYALSALSRLGFSPLYIVMHSGMGGPTSQLCVRVCMPPIRAFLGKLELPTCCCITLVAGLFSLAWQINQQSKHERFKCKYQSMWSMGDQLQLKPPVW
jgi:hypothetical protein